jgi:hypothetical protein
VKEFIFNLRNIGSVLFVLKQKEPKNSSRQKMVRDLKYDALFILDETIFGDGLGTHFLGLNI